VGCVPTFSTSGDGRLAISGTRFGVDDIRLPDVSGEDVEEWRAVCGRIVDGVPRPIDDDRGCAALLANIDAAAYSTGKAGKTERA
jgi:hypothetical protein